jgi:hypothetical protein
MTHKIGNFRDFLNEGLQEEEFKTRLFKALKDANLEYDVESSSTQLKNGTVIIRMRDLNVVKKALDDREIDEDDFISKQHLDKFYAQWRKPQINLYRDVDTGLAKYTIYSRGGIRLLSASGDAYKFDSKTEAGIKSAVDWLINHYSVWVIQTATNRLNSDKFTKYKKGYDLDLSKLSQYMDPVVIKFLEGIKTDSQKKFEEIAPNIMALCYLAKEEETIVKLTYETKLTNMQFSVKSKDVDRDIEFFVSQDWSVGTKTPTIKMTLNKTWYYRSYRNSQTYPTATAMAKGANLPQYQQSIIAKLLKAPNYDLDKFDTDYAGAKSGTKFGL